MTDANASHGKFEVGSLVLLKNNTNNIWKEGKIKRITDDDLHKEACAIIVTRTLPEYLLRWKITNYDYLNNYFEYTTVHTEEHFSFI